MPRIQGKVKRFEGWLSRKGFSEPAIAPAVVSREIDSSYGDRSLNGSNSASADFAMRIEGSVHPTLLTDALVTTICMGSEVAKKEAVIKLRLLSKIDEASRMAISEAEAIPILIEILNSDDYEIQENAIACLLNLSLHDRNKRAIMDIPDAVDNISKVLNTGLTIEAKQNAATTLFSLMSIEEYRDTVGENDAVIPGLLRLLEDSAFQSKKDALKGLFHLSSSDINKLRLVRAGAVSKLLSIIQQRRALPEHSKNARLIEDVLTVCSLIGKCREGALEISQAGAIPLLVKILEPGESMRSRENAAAVLLNLCQTGGEAMVEEVLDCNLCMSALSALVSSGSVRGRQKAGALLQVLMINERCE